MSTASSRPHADGPRARRTRRPRWAARLASAAALAWAAPALAGPPYVTDDPVPTDLGHWEVFAYASGVRTPGDTAGEAGVDMNYGAAKDLQLNLVVPAAFDISDGWAGGLGVVQAAAKYRLLHQDEDGIAPDLAIYPRVFIPTARGRFASTRPNLFLPVWGQKDFGPWSVFGGGGWRLNPGPGKNFWFSGLAVTRDLSSRLNLGVEVYHQTREALEGQDFTGANLGVVYKLTDHWALMASGGHGLQNAASGGDWDFYLALQALY
jgi:hypothetical protein